MASFSSSQKVISSRRRSRRKTPRYFKILLGILGCYLLFSFLVGGYQIWQIKKDVAAEQLLTKCLRQQQDDLEKELALLQEPGMIETLARENLGLVRPGEILVVPAVPGENIPKPR